MFIILLYTIKHYGLYLKNIYRKDVEFQKNSSNYEIINVKY